MDVTFMSFGGGAGCLEDGAGGAVTSGGGREGRGGRGGGGGGGGGGGFLGGGGGGGGGVAGWSGGADAGRVTAGQGAVDLRVGVHPLLGPALDLTGDPGRDAHGDHAVGDDHAG